MLPNRTERLFMPALIEIAGKIITATLNNTILIEKRPLLTSEQRQRLSLKSKSVCFLKIRRVNLVLVVHVRLINLNCNLMNGRRTKLFEVVCVPLTACPLYQYRTSVSTSEICMKSKSR